MNLPELVQPVLTCFEDPDARVRYYACESLYNISKVARGAVLVFFNSIFDGLCKVSVSGGTMTPLSSAAEWVWFPKHKRNPLPHTCIY